jgi:hypothetical protein
MVGYYTNQVRIKVEVETELVYNRIVTTTESVFSTNLRDLSSPKRLDKERTDINIMKTPN